MPSTFSTRRLVLVSLALFLIILAFLAGRVRAGADPTQVTAPASSSTPAPQTETYDTDPYGDGSRGAPPGFSPDQGGAVPDQGGAVPGQDADPPATHAS